MMMAPAGRYSSVTGLPSERDAPYGFLSMFPDGVHFEDYQVLSRQKGCCKGAIPKPHR